jgi:hypothetical protein
MHDNDTPPQSWRALRSKMASHESWARTPDRAARTAPARAAMLAKFEAQVDPDGTLDPAERAIRAEHARKAYFTRLSLRSVQARRKIAAELDAAAQAEAELRQLGDGGAA